MARTQQLLDARGNPVKRGELREEVASPKFASGRSPISGYPGDGLTPVRLAQILRSADYGEPLQYLELAETIEERDPHYHAVLGTRKRSVSQIGMTVEPASEAPNDIKIAKVIEDWLKRDELVEELFLILDAIGKGYSFTEIIWERSMGQWFPARLEQRDPRWFRFDRSDLATPKMISDHGTEVDLPAFKFIFAQMKAKSGLVTRSGLARVAMWGYLFKKFTERDWAIFTQTFGQPLRVGKWGQGASETDKDILFEAVANIAGDCAAIIPDSMLIEFVEAGNLGTSHQLYKERADWLDQQISKAVLGQTTSTDAIAGGHAVSKEHRQVQEDIERADAISLQAILNRDVIRPFVQLEFGPQPRYPRLIIARPEQEDLTRLATALGTLVPLGLQVSEQEVRGKFGLSEPKKGEQILGAKSLNTKDDPENDVIAGQSADKTARDSQFEYRLNGLEQILGTLAPQNAETPLEANFGDKAIVGELADRLHDQAQPSGVAMMGRIQAMVDGAASLEELKAMLLDGFDDLDSEGFADAMTEALIAAEAGGRALTEDEADG